MNIPFVDLKAQYRSMKDEIDIAISDVIERTAFAGGPFVEEFEKDFAAYCGTRYAIGCGSGTDALLIALKALGIGSGDEVVTVPNSFFATVEAICLCGATPVFVDVLPDTMLMDDSCMKKAITGNTKAIIPVHLFGQIGRMDKIGDIASRHGIPIIEDACQAHGAKMGDQTAGSIGTAGCFSFYPGKNLGAYGEAGAITTDREDIYEAAMSLRSHGEETRYHHRRIGWNSRMDGFQGAILRAKLKHLDEWTGARIRIADEYERLLIHPDIQLPVRTPGNRHVYHLFPIRIPHRDKVMEEIRSRGIACGVHYPIPIHLQEAFPDSEYNIGDFPVTEDASQRMLSLPIFPEMTQQQIDFVAATVVEVLDDQSSSS